MISFRLLCVAAAALCMTACSWAPRSVGEYRIDIQQGNVLSQEQVLLLKPGLSKDQVRFILGTPVLADMFHANRWDYVYRYTKGKTGEVEMRNFSVFFDQDGKLFRVGGDVTAATAADATATPEKQTREIDLGSVDPGTKAPPIENRGFFGSILESMGF